MADFQYENKKDPEVAIVDDGQLESDGDVDVAIGTIKALVNEDHSHE